MAATNSIPKKMTWTSTLILNALPISVVAQPGAVNHRDGSFPSHHPRPQPLAMCGRQPRARFKGTLPRGVFHKQGPEFSVPSRTVGICRQLEPVSGFGLENVAVCRKMHSNTCKKSAECITDTQRVLSSKWAIISPKRDG